MAPLGVSLNALAYGSMLMNRNCWRDEPRDEIGHVRIVLGDDEIEGRNCAENHAATWPGCRQSEGTWCHCHADARWCQRVGEAGVEILGPVRMFVPHSSVMRCMKMETDWGMALVVGGMATSSLNT